ncbi:MAG TPA: LacI family DNA-binding transcriptional regulator [Chloroflexota bacterium]|nr:LacI family DNA-binding transcriptional regulator [Chloroflexota bacterium]
MAGGKGTRRQHLTITDIATLTGLSKATVSRAINDRKRVSPETRARVLAVLDDVGYVRNRAATSLSTGRTGLIGLMIGENRDPLASTVMQGALAAAGPAGYGVVVYITAHEREHEAIYTEMAARGGIDGALLLFPARHDAPLARRIAERGLPLVLIEPQMAIPGLPTVRPDVYDDGYRCTRYLLELGHRRIGLCADASDWGITEPYIEGYRAALAEAGIPFDPNLALAAGWTYAAGYQTAMRWLQLPDPPTSMCFCCDAAALGAIAAARERGVPVPGGLSVIGYDDAEIAQWITPALTTPCKRRFALVQRACELLLDLIGGAEPPVQPVLLKTDLIVRQSTAQAIT